MALSEENQSAKAPKPVGSYPLFKKFGDLIFLSGVGPRSADDNSVPGNEYDDLNQLISYDIEKQCHSVFENVKSILELAGTSWENILDVTVFLTDMSSDFKKFNALYADYFAQNQPTRTTVEVQSLPTPIAIELKVIAHL